MLRQHLRRVSSSHARHQLLREDHRVLKGHDAAAADERGFLPPGSAASFSCGIVVLLKRKQTDRKFGARANSDESEALGR